jgi:hypothetical protein
MSMLGWAVIRRHTPTGIAARGQLLLPHLLPDKARENTGENLPLRARFGHRHDRGSRGPPPDGTRVISLPGDARWKCNVDWFVRLTVAQGRLSGVHVGSLEGTKRAQTIRNLVVNPDGSFAGATFGITTAGLQGTRWSISGQFSGDTVSVATRPVSPGGCPGRTGQATRSND